MHGVLETRWSYNSSNNNTFRFINLAIIFSSVHLYILNQLVLKPLNISAFFQGHFNDALGMIMLLSYTNLILSLYKRKRKKVEKLFSYNKQIILTNPFYIILYAFLVGLFWEFVTPLYKKTSTSDWYDVLTYIISAVIYYCIISICSKEHKDRI